MTMGYGCAKRRDGSTLLIVTECLARTADFQLIYMGHDDRKSEAIQRLNACFAANTLADEADMALVADLPIFDDADVSATDLQIGEAKRFR